MLSLLSLRCPVTLAAKGQRATVASPRLIADPVSRTPSSGFLYLNKTCFHSKTNIEEQYQEEAYNTTQTNINPYLPSGLSKDPGTVRGTGW